MAPSVPAGAVDLDNGARLYRQACQACHGPTGGGGQGGGATFTSALTREGIWPPMSSSASAGRD